MPDIPVVGICPTIFEIPQFENLRRVQCASFGEAFDIVYAGEEWAGWMERWTTPDKIVSLFEMVAESMPDVMDHGYILLLHHDVVLEDAGVFWSLIYKMAEDGIAVAGPSECDGLMRNNYSGRGYCHSAFMVVDPRKVGRWWEVDRWIDNGWESDGRLCRLRGSDRYWKISLDAKGNILFLGSRWPEPRSGNETQITYGDRLLATHLWLSTGDIRVNGHWQTVEGEDPVELACARRRFCERYSERHGVGLVECDDTVRGLDYYRRWGGEAISSDALRKRFQTSSEVLSHG